MRFVIFVASLLFCALLLRAEDQVKCEPLFPNSDFEKGSLENWTAEGTAFKSQPTKGDNAKARGRGNSNIKGEYWIGTYENCPAKDGKPGKVQGDKPVGKLKSVEFTIKSKYINFMIGGGNHPGKTGVSLLVDGKPLRTATALKHSETMQKVSWDVSDLVGKKAVLEIIDQASGGWGHVNADDFTGSDKPAGKVIK